MYNKATAFAIAASLSASLLATEYKWTGEANDGSWKNPNNWDQQAGYPCQSNDIALFGMSATVTFDAGPDTPLNAIKTEKTTGVEVSINADSNGSSIRFSDQGGPKAADGTILRMGVPISCEARFNPSSGKGATVYFSNTLTNLVPPPQNMYFGGLGSYVLEGDCDIFTINRTDLGWYGNSPQGTVVNHYLRGNARFTATNSTSYGYINMVGNGSTKAPSVYLEQDGDDTAMTLTTLNLGGYSGSTTPYHDDAFALYRLKRGTFTILDTLNVGTKVYGSYVQEGGTATVAKLVFGNKLAPDDKFEILGGSFTVGTVSGTPATSVLLSNCTFRTTGSLTASFPIMLAGTVGIAAPTGKEIQLNNVSAPGGCVVDSAGEGTVYLQAVGEFVQNGGDVSFNRLDVGDTKTGSYTLQGGSLAAAGLKIGGMNSARMNVLGGTLTVPTISTSSRGVLDVSGGTLAFTGDTNFNPDDFRISMSNATFRAQGGVTMGAVMDLSGTVTFDVAAGKKLTFSVPPRLAPGTLIRKTGAGELDFACDFIWRGDMEIVEGQVTMTHEVDNADGDDSVRNLTIRDGAVLYTGNVVHKVNVPIDLKIYGEGYVRSDFTSSIFPVRHLWTNDVAVARGAIFNCGDLTTAGAPYRYKGSSGSATHNRSPMVISYTWTGGGDGKTWSDSANWEDGEIPLDHSGHSYADLSRATDIVLTADVDIAGPIFCGNKGDRTLVIHADAAQNFYTYVPQAYQPEAYIATGRTIIFRNVKFPRSPTAGNNVGYVLGFGTMILEGNCHGGYVPAGMPRTAGTVLYRYATNTAYQANAYGFSINTDIGLLCFGEGTDMKFQNSYAGVSGHANLKGQVFLPGCKVRFREGLYVTRYHGNVAYNVRIEGGDVSVEKAAGISIGTLNVFNNTNVKMHGLETFEMLGGSLTVERFASECNRNHAYLMGGDIYVGAGGFVVTDTHTTNAATCVVSWSPNTDPVVFWGGTAIHATNSFTVSLEMELTGEGGEPVLDVPTGFQVTLATNMTGSAALVKTGGGALMVSNAVQSVSMRIEEGTLTFDGDADFTASMGSLVLASDACLSIPAGKTLKVTSLVSGGIVRTGTIAWGDGFVEVTGEGTADWLAPAVYTKEFTAACNDAKSLDGIHYAYAAGSNGTLTVSGTGSLEFAADSRIYVRPGDTLVFEVPVSLAGRLDILGGGDVVFESTATLSAPVDPTYLYVHDGSRLVLRSVVNGGAKGISMYAVTRRLGERYSTIRIEAGGYLCQEFYACTFSGEDSSIGGVLEIAEGGEFRLPRTDNYSRIGASANIHETLRLCGGTFNPATYLRYYTGDVELRFESGKIFVNNTGTMLSRDFTVDLGGKIDFASMTETPVSTIAADIVGDGEIVQSGSNTVVLCGAQTGVRRYSAQCGTLAFGETAAATCRRDVRIDASSDATVKLDFTGIMTVGSLFLDGKHLIKGIYGADTSPTARRPNLTGPGFLEVLEGERPGVVIHLR